MIASSFDVGLGAGNVSFGIMTLETAGSATTWENVCRKAQSRESTDSRGQAATAVYNTVGFHIAMPDAVR
jgi:hypothetical protein